MAARATVAAQALANSINEGRGLGRRVLRGAIGEFSAPTPNNSPIAARFATTPWTPSLNAAVRKPPRTPKPTEQPRAPHPSSAIAAPTTPPSHVRRAAGSSAAAASAAATVCAGDAGPVTTATGTPIARSSRRDGDQLAWPA